MRFCFFGPEWRCGWLCGSREVFCEGGGKGGGVDLWICGLLGVGVGLWFTGWFLEGGGVVFWILHLGCGFEGLYVGLCVDVTG